MWITLLQMEMLKVLRILILLMFKPHIVKINNINYLLFDNSNYIFINGYDKKIEFKDIENYIKSH